MAKTAIFLANGFEEIEGLTVVDILRRAKIDITMVSITGTKAVEGSHGIKLEEFVITLCLQLLFHINQRGHLFKIGNRHGSAFKL